MRQHTHTHTFFLRMGTPRTIYIISSRFVLDCDREENASLPVELWMIKLRLYAQALVSRSFFFGFVPPVVQPVKGRVEAQREYGQSTTRVRTKSQHANAYARARW